MNSNEICVENKPNLTFVHKYSNSMCANVLLSTLDIVVVHGKFH